MHEWSLELYVYRIRCAHAWVGLEFMELSLHMHEQGLNLWN